MFSFHLSKHTLATKSWPCFHVGVHFTSQTCVPKWCRNHSCQARFTQRLKPLCLCTPFMGGARLSEKRHVPEIRRATKTIREMEVIGVKPNVKTYTTLINGWARASLPEKALRCFEDMKLAGLKPDKAVYHCLMTSLLARSTVAEAYYTGALSICREMIESGLTVDMGTAVHWSKCLRKIERTGGELTEALQKTFPPDWSSYHLLDANTNTDTDNEPDIGGDDDGIYFDDETDDDDDLHELAL